MIKVLKGQMTALFAFDIGYGIRLEAVASMLDSTQVQPISQKKRTPPYLQYARLPHRVRLEPARGFFDAEGTVQLTLYDFGAASISYSWPLSDQDRHPLLDEIPRLVQNLYHRSLEADAKHRIQSLV